MQLQQLTNWLQTKLHPIVVRTVVAVVVIASLTAIVLGIIGSDARASNFSLTAAVPEIVVYRSPDCSCCGGWSNHLKAQGFKVKDFTTTDIEAVKQKYNVPQELTSCHTAIIDGYIIEGHVPAPDIKRLLKEQPSFTGLSVPQMPLGTPGMEIGNQKDPFSVLSFDSQGKVAIFNNYPSM